MLNTLKISQLISKLQEVQKRFGDVKIVLSCDSEGNSFGTITNDMSLSFDSKAKVAILYPVEEGIYELL